MPTLSKISPCLWFDGEAEAAATLYTTIFPDSRILTVDRAPADTPSGPAGMVLTVTFAIGDQTFIALNGGPEFTFSEAISFSIDCDGQAEVDRLWDALIADGGEPSMCGWLKDRFGVSWQIIPRRLPEMLQSPDRDAARRAMESMLTMQKLDVRALEAAYAGTPSPG